MATLHIKGQVCQYVYTGTANCTASIPFVGIAGTFELVWYHATTMVIVTTCSNVYSVFVLCYGSQPSIVSAEFEWGLENVYYDTIYGYSNYMQ